MFLFSRSIAGLLMITSESVYQALAKNGEALVLSLKISKAFDRFWHTGFKLKNLNLFGRNKKMSSPPFFNIFNSNAGFLHCSVLGPSLFLILNSDRPDDTMFFNSVSIVWSVQIASYFKEMIYSLLLTGARTKLLYMIHLSKPFLHGWW